MNLPRVVQQLQAIYVAAAAPRHRPPPHRIPALPVLICYRPKRACNYSGRHILLCSHSFTSRQQPRKCITVLGLCTSERGRKKIREAYLSQPVPHSYACKSHISGSRSNQYAANHSAHERVCKRDSARYSPNESWLTLNVTWTFFSARWCLPRGGTRQTAAGKLST